MFGESMSKQESAQSAPICHSANAMFEIVAIGEAMEHEEDVMGLTPRQNVHLAISRY